MLACHLVKNYNELCSAFNLVYKEYQKLGYTLPDEDISQMRFGVHQLFNESKTFILKINNAICGTGSFVLDSELGLPCESIFKEDIARLRDHGKRLAEGTLLACIPYHGIDSAQISAIILHSYHLLRSYAVDNVLVVVNPRHVKYWMNNLSFTKVSEIDTYKKVKNAPGILIKLDLEKVSERINQIQKFLEMLLHTSLNVTNIAPQFEMNHKHVEQLLMKAPHLLQEISEKVRYKLSETYPDFFLNSKNNFSNDTIFIQHVEKSEKRVHKNINKNIKTE
ncbi:MAG: hypothetical protein H7A32_01035 [Deltaproteobacteria bacterium]|nr:hypothetical protein [Deltaproteobacteria bacterium]